MIERNREQPEAWQYASYQKPTLRARIWEALSSRVALIVLAIVTLSMPTIALSVGVMLIR